MFKPLAPLPANMKVCSLLSQDNKSWDVDMVRGCLDARVADAILQIPISHFGGSDFATWPHTKLGIYSVKSAYNLARSATFFAAQSVNGKGLSSDLCVEEKHWKALWAIKAPGKMKIVLWRAAHDCLPTGFQLQRRHIPTQDDCIFCGRSERVEHLLLFCPFAQGVWNAVKNFFPMDLCKKQLVNAKQWIFDFLDRGSSLLGTVLAVSIWHIWEARNDARNNDSEMCCRRVADKIKAYVEMIVQNLSKINLAARCDSSGSVLRWSPPPAGFLLINSDAALFSNSHQMGIGVVVRDQAGDCLFACNKRLEGMMNPELAEAVACRFALCLARDEGHSKVIMASDCLSLIQRINSTAKDLSNVGTVVADIKKIAASFLVCSFTHVKRQFNVPAHILARSCEQSVSQVYRGVIPVCIQESLCNDSNV
jgi:hypothetical protein